MTTPPRNGQRTRGGPANGQQQTRNGFWDPNNPSGYWAGSEHDTSSSRRQQSSGTNGQQRGQQQSGGRSSNYSPLADPEFFTNADVRTYCDTARAALLQVSFEMSMAAEVLNAVLKEVPDPEGKPFGSKMRARRVSRRLSKAADDAKDAAKNAAATYAAFQREFSPELEPVRMRKTQQRRTFDFNG